MMVLVIVGVALVGLGALVLLKFPDRPGGKSHGTALK
jgi:multisubunit Na+/H+ antiporter MnhG subunit